MFSVGMLSTNCFVANCEETLEAVIIDPGFEEDEADRVISAIENGSLKVKMIINTHGHPDHTGGNAVLKKRFNVPIAIHENDAHMLGATGRVTARFFGFNCFSPPADMILHDGDSLRFGNDTLAVVHTPGHSRGSIILVGENEIFSGDTLFAESIGRTDFPGSSENDMNISLSKLLQFPDSYVVYPGHGPITTLGHEKHSNPFLLQL
jgi:hydroxyacylglutathione hydrolase